MGPNAKGSRRVLPLKRRQGQSHHPSSQKTSKAPKDAALREHQKKVLKQCLDEIEALPRNPETGRIRRGEKKRITDVYLAANSSWLTEDMIKTKRWREQKKVKDDTASLATENRDNMKDPPPAHPVQLRPPRAALEDLKPVALPGRKKGTTKAAIRDRKQRFIDMKNDIARTWADKEKRPKIPMATFISQKQQEYGFDTGKPEDNVSPYMVYSRLKRGQVENKGTKGQHSPLRSIEPRIVMMIKLSSACNQELTEKEILLFVNDYIAGSQLEQDVIDWKLMNNATWRNNYVSNGIRPTKACIQSPWFHSFVKRWADEISYSKSTNTAHYRKEFCTYENFARMYDGIYKLLEEGGYAERLPSAVLMDKEGNRCSDPADSYGKPVDLKFTRPDLVFVADECGTNTNMAKDRVSGGNKRVHEIGTKVTLPSCNSDVHFTTMGITSLDGRPVCCVVIIQKKGDLNQSERFGFDVDAEWHGDMRPFDEIKDKLQSENRSNVRVRDIPIIPRNWLAANMGPGKAFPGGPDCFFNGNTIPTFVTSSESGGITPYILVSILRHLDHHGAISRNPDDPPPCLIVDGHGSRLSIPFLRYINNLDSDGKVDPKADHRWKVFVGQPHGTAYWQVADSSEINGKFKLRMRKAKENVRDSQRDFGEKIAIKTHHVILMIRECWDSCFGDVRNNKKAIAERGWNPLNRGCLVMPDIEKTKPAEEIVAENKSVPERIDVDNNTKYVCAARECCGMGNRPFTEKDTHRCKTCGERVHGVLCCVMIEEEEGSGPFYCKKCGRPGASSAKKKCRSEIEELRYAQENPNHCQDMNPSGEDVFRVIERFQDSKRRNEEAEKRQKAMKQRLKDGRSDNELRRLLVQKKTTGALVGAGVYDLSREAVLDSVEAMEKKKIADEYSVVLKRYNKRIKIYEEGVDALRKERLHEEVVQTLTKAANEKERKNLMKTARKEKKLLLNDDYLALIKFKQLGIPKDQRKQIPPSLKERKIVWHSTYKEMSDPMKPQEPVKPVDDGTDDAVERTELTQDSVGGLLELIGEQADV